MAKQTFTTGQVLTAAQMTSLQQTAMGGGSTTAKTTSYVLVAADAGTVVQMNAAGATTITINTALFAAGDSVQIQNIGAGVCTVTAGTATVTTAGSLALSQWEGGQLYFTSTGSAIFFDIVQAATSIPLTTKGDLFGYDTANARVPIGTNNQVLTADSAQALGLKWATPTSSAPVNGQSQVLTSQATTSASYVDLATVQAVTVTTGTRALVLLSAVATAPSPASVARGYMSVAVSGATTVAASNDYAYLIQGNNTVAYPDTGAGTSFILTGLTAGSNTFTAKFSAPSATSFTWEDRRIVVIDMGS